MAAIKETEMAIVEAPTGLTGFQPVMRCPGTQSQRQERIAETSASVGPDVYSVRVDRADLQNTTEGSR
jgi:hypothetical protein